MAVNFLSFCVVLNIDYTISIYRTEKMNIHQYHFLLLLYVVRILYPTQNQNYETNKIFTATTARLNYYFLRSVHIPTWPGTMVWYVERWNPTWERNWFWIFFWYSSTVALSKRERERERDRALDALASTINVVYSAHHYRVESTVGKTLSRTYRMARRLTYLG